jgi:hypothetical protein
MMIMKRRSLIIITVMQNSDLYVISLSSVIYLGEYVIICRVLAK